MGGDSSSTLSIIGMLWNWLNNGALCGCAHHDAGRNSIIFEDVKDENYGHFRGKVGTLLKRTSCSGSPPYAQLPTRKSRASRNKSPTYQRRGLPKTPSLASEETSPFKGLAREGSEPGQCITPNGRCVVPPARLSMSSAGFSPARRETIGDDVNFDPKRFTEFPLDFPQQIEVEFDFNDGKLGVQAMRIQDVLIIESLKSEGLVQEWNRTANTLATLGERAKKEASDEGARELGVLEQKKTPRLKSYSSAIVDCESDNAIDGSQPPAPIVGKNCLIQQGDRIIQVNDCTEVDEMIMILQEAHQNRKDVTVTFTKRLSSFLVTLLGTMNVHCTETRHSAKTAKKKITSDSTASTRDTTGSSSKQGDVIDVTTRATTAAAAEEATTSTKTETLCPLGLEFDVREDSVYVKSISRGLVTDWNTSNPMKGVYVGDTIESANGVFGPKLIEFIEKWQRKQAEPLYLSIQNVSVNDDMP